MQCNAAVSVCLMHHPVSVWKLFRGQMRQPGAQMLHHPFCVMVRESENNVEHLSSRGAPSGIFLGRHSSFDIGMVACFML